MNIDWITLIAQIVNFIIIVILLKFLLYDRIVKAMKERKQNIQDSLNEADQKKEEAEDTLKEYQGKKEELADEKEKIISEARDKAKEEEKKLIKEARDDVKQMRSEWKAALEKEKENFIRETKEKVGAQVFSISRKVLSDLANEDMEKNVAAKFIDRIEKMNEEEIGKFNEFIKDKENELIINSSAELSDDKRKRIEKILKEKLNSSPALNFQTDSKMICGIELKVDGHRIAWSLDSYLQNLQEFFEKKLKDHLRQEKKKEKKEKE